MEGITKKPERISIRAGRSHKSQRGAPLKRRNRKAAVERSETFFIYFFLLSYTSIRSIRVYSYSMVVLEIVLVIVLGAVLRHAFSLRSSKEKSMSSLC